MVVDKKFIKNLLIFDAHCDTANILMEKNIFFEENSYHLDFEKIKAGGLKAQIFALWVNPSYSKNNPSNMALSLLKILEKKIFSRGYADKVSSIDEMNISLKNSTLACWLFLEGGHIIENSIQKLKLFRSLGVSGITITHNKNTDWADSSGDNPRWDGLNKKGIGFLKKIEELKMFVDISHSSDKTVNDVMDVYSKPIMASHSNSRYLCKIDRNLSDNIINEIGQNGGFIGVNFFPGFLNKKIYNQIKRNFDFYKKEYEKKFEENLENPCFIRKLDYDFSMNIIKNNDVVNLNEVIDHIVHISEVGGIDVVGLGSDFDGIPSTPYDLKNVSFYPKLVEGLYDRGFKSNEIKKIMGLNLYNFFKKNSN